jgi:hypothetical protein
MTDRRRAELRNVRAVIDAKDETIRNLKVALATCRRDQDRVVRELLEIREELLSLYECG